MSRVLLLLLLPSACAAFSAPAAVVARRVSPPALGRFSQPSLRLPTVAAAQSSAAVFAGIASAASAAAERAVIANELDDRFVVGFALFVLIATGLLNLSLGDVAGDEAMLPSSTSNINDLRKRRSSFLKSRGPPTN